MSTLIFILGMVAGAFAGYLATFSTRGNYRRSIKALRRSAGYVGINQARRDEYEQLAQGLEHTILRDLTPVKSLVYQNEGYEQ